MSNYVCEQCGKEFFEDFRKHRRTPPRFCSLSCAYSFTRSKQNRTEKKVDTPGFCQFCKKLCKNKNSLKQHEIRCHENENRIDNNKGKFEIDSLNYVVIGEAFICNYCGNSYKSLNSLGLHQGIYCKKNPNIEARDGSNQYIYNRKHGLPDYVVSKQTRKKQSQNIKKRLEKNPNFAKNVGKKTSRTINKKVREGTWHTSIIKNIFYKDVHLHSKWELAYAEYLDSRSIIWERCSESFPYVFEGKERRYFPDFYLVESREYIEIKGYQREKDDAKWSQFPKDLTLKVLKEKDLKYLLKDDPRLLALI